MAQRNKLYLALTTHTLILVKRIHSFSFLVFSLDLLTTRKTEYCFILWKCGLGFFFPNIASSVQNVFSPNLDSLLPNISNFYFSEFSQRPLWHSAV